MAGAGAESAGGPSFGKALASLSSFSQVQDQSRFAEMGFIHTAEIHTPALGISLT